MSCSAGTIPRGVKVKDAGWVFDMIGYCDLRHRMTPEERNKVCVCVCGGRERDTDRDRDRETRMLYVCLCDSCVCVCVCATAWRIS